MRITIDTSDIVGMITQDEIDEAVIETAEDIANEIFVDLTASPPVGTPVDTGAARNGWQIDNSIPGAPELYNRVPYINRLNNGHSSQSPSGFIDTAVDKAINKPR